MTPEFLRRYYILRIISNPKVYGIEKNGFVPLTDLQNALHQLRVNNIDDLLYDKLSQNGQKTIKRDLEKIKSYYQTVILHKRNYGYFVEETEVTESLKEVYEKTEIYLLHHHAHKWKSYVSTSRNSLSAQVDLVPLIHAIEHQFKVELDYQGWYDDNGFQNVSGIFQPLHLKEINKSWYLMAHNQQYGTYTFCLDDRIKSFKINKQNVKHPILFNAFDYFENTIGILKTGMQPEWIHIKVSNHHYKYLLNNPLHHSQHIVAPPLSLDTDDLDYSNPDIWGELKVFIEPNYEFLMEILKCNLWVRIESPLHVKNYVKEHLVRIMNYYE